MHTGQDIFTYNTLVQYDGILIIVALPRHVSNKQVLAKCQFTCLGRVAFCQDITSLNTLSFLTDRTEVDGHILVGTTELGNTVFLHRRFEAYEVLFLCTVVENTDCCSINIIHNTLALGSNHCAAVLTYLLLNAGTYNRSLGTEQGNCLAHHVTAHQCTVSIVMLQEGNQTSSDRGNLLRSNVHQIHLCGRNNWVVIVATALNHLTDKRTILAQGSITLTDNQFLLFLCAIISDTVRRKVNHTILYLSVWSLNETKVVYLCIYTKTADQTNVWTFRRLDRTKTAIVCEMHVTNLETGTLTRKTARTEGRKTTLMCYLRQGVGLVHELAQSICSEEGIDNTGDCLRVDKFCGTEHLIVAYIHAFANSTAHAGKTD